MLCLFSKIQLRAGLVPSPAPAHRGNGDECYDRDPTYSWQPILSGVRSPSLAGGVCNPLLWKMLSMASIAVYSTRAHSCLLLFAPQPRLRQVTSQVDCPYTRSAAMCCRSNQKDRSRAVPCTTAHRYDCERPIEWHSAVLAASRTAPCVASALGVALTATYLPCLLALPSMGCSIVVELPAVTAIVEVAVTDTVAMIQWDF